MSAVAVVAPNRRPAQSGLRVTQLRVIASEWTKFWTLRSTVWTLLTAVALTVGIGALFSWIISNQFDSLNPAQLANLDPVSTSLAGTLFSQLTMGVLAVLLISGEYSTGMIRSSLTVVPKRLPVLWAKLMVFAGVIFLVTLVASFVAFFLGQALIGHGLGVSISAPGALRSVIGAALYVTIAGMIGMALGSLLRNTAAGISTLVGVFFVLPPLAQALPSSFSSHFVQYLPSNAGSAMFGSANNLANGLSPAAGLAVLCGYAVILIGAAAWRLKKIDA